MRDNKPKYIFVHPFFGKSVSYKNTDAAISLYTNGLTIIVFKQHMTYLKRPENRLGHGTKMIKGRSTKIRPIWNGQE